MCVTRAGRVISVKGGRAVVRFFDDSTLGDVDVSTVKASRGSYVEVFATLALGCLSRREAEARRRAWSEVRRAAMLAA